MNLRVKMMRKMSQTSIYKANAILLFILFAFIGLNQLYANNLDSLITIAEAKYASINDYTCMVSKKEMVNGEYIEWKNVFFKHKKPDNYYMKWTEGSSEGKEILYAGKKYDYKMKAHLGGILNVINVNVDPKGSTAMKESRHNIFESDLGFVIKLIKTNLQLSRQQKVGYVTFVKEVKVNNSLANLYKAEFPKSKGFYCHVIYLYLDKNLNLPVKFDVFDWSDKMIGSYTFSDIKLNVGLKEYDFNINNKSYHF